MDGARFDRFARTLSSRRTALGGLLGGSLAAFLGVAIPEEAGAHVISVARCRRIKSAPRRRACIRRTRAHNRTCHPQPLATTCFARCGTVANNCGQSVTCPCPGVQVCVDNDFCCTPEPPATTCAGRCRTVTDNCGQAVSCTCPPNYDCRVEGTEGTCRSCLATQATCTTAEQCCQDGGAQGCGPVAYASQPPQCCRPVGGACSNPGQIGECCAVTIPGEGAIGQVICASNHTCGGPGVSCSTTRPNGCVSGLCCALGGALSGTCCAAGQGCVNGQCV